MSDEVSTNQDESVANETSTNDTKTTDHSNNTPPETIPYSRFSETVNANKKLSDEIAQMKADAKAAAEAEAEKKGEYEKLYKDNLNKINEYDTLNDTFKSMLDARLERIPEEKRSLIPSDYPPHKQLEWIELNNNLFGESESPNKNNPTKPSEDDNSKVYHKIEDIQKPEYYDKHAEDIKKALLEDRVVE